MKTIMGSVTGAVFVVLFLAVTPAQAYVDPGSGSLILQLLLAGAAGLIVIIRMMWGRILGIFRSNNTSGQKGDKSS